MASTRTFPIYRDTLLAKSGSTPVGGGNDEHLPVGVAGSYNCKAALKFTLDWSGMTEVISARLYLKTTTKVHALSWGASPTLIVERLDNGANFTENSGRSSYDDPAGSGWSGSASDFDSAAVGNGANDTNWTPGNNENTWYSVDITAIVKAWGPTSIPGCSATPNYGLLIRPSANAVSETIEFYSRKSAYDPYIVVTYESNIAPTATVTAPVNNARLLSTDLTPAIACAFVEANSIASYDIQVATDAAFTSLVWDLVGSTTGLAGTAPNWTSTIPYAGTALVPGTVYYVRARATDNEAAVGAYSPTISFRLNRPPTSAGGFGSGFVAAIHNLADLAVWTSGGSWAKPEFKFTPTDLDADPITGYEVRISLAGTPVATDSIVGTFASGVQVMRQHAYALVNGTLYTVAFRSRDAYEWGPWTSELSFRVRWGEATYEAPVPAGSANWRITFGTLAGDGAVMATAYRKATGASGAGATAWAASIPTPLPGAGYFNVRVRISSSGSVPTQPSLPDMTFTYDASAALPTGWSYAGSAGLDTNVRRYGQNSVRLDAVAGGGTSSAYQDIAVSEDTDYTFSAWVKLEAELVNATARVRLYTPSGTFLTQVILPAGLSTSEWHRITGTYRTAPGQTTVRFYLAVVSTAGASGSAWFDAALLDEGTVAGQWTPALVGLPVVIDAQGIIIDSGAGGMLRIDGTVIKPAPYVGTDAPPGPTDGQLWWDTDDASYGGASAADAGTAFPSSPAVNRVFFRTDIGMAFQWNGLRWLCTCPHVMGEGGGSGYPLSASGQSFRHACPTLLGCSDIWLVSYDFTFYVAAGTALAAGTQQWSGNFIKEFATTNVSLGTILVASGALTTWRSLGTVALNQLLHGGAGPYLGFEINWTKTGTPGNFYPLVSLAYRYVG